MRIRKNVLVVAVIVATALWLIPAQRASAQYIARTRANRDEAIQACFANGPFYVVVTGDGYNAIAETVTVVAPAIDGASYMVNEGFLYIAFTTTRGNRLLLIGFAADKETLEAMKAASEADGVVFLGPFGGDPSEAALKAAQQRILNAVKAYIANPASLPKIW